MGGDAAGGVTWQKLLLLSLVLFALSLVADLAQYAWYFYQYDRLRKAKEAEIHEARQTGSKVEDLIERPPNLHFVGECLMWSKVVLGFLAYAFLVGYIGARLVK